MPAPRETKVTQSFPAAPEAVFAALNQAVMNEGYDPKGSGHHKLVFAVHGDEVTIIVEPAPDGAGSVATLYDEAQGGADPAASERDWQAMLAMVARTLV